MKNILKAILEYMRIILLSIYKIAGTLHYGKRARFNPEPEKEVIILGNGPSLNDIDLYEVNKSNLDIACVNFFPTRNECFAVIKPKYLVLLDPGFYGERENLDSQVKELYDKLERVSWEMTILCLQNRKLPINNPKITFEKINISVLHSEKMHKFLDALYRRNLLCLGMRNVIIGAGFYFVCKRYKHIYYAGVDMSEFKMLFVDEQNRVYVDAVHNYGKERHYSTIIGKGEFYQLLEMYQGMFKELHFLAEFAERSGVQVTNLSVNSYIDVFEKKHMFEKRKAV